MQKVNRSLQLFSLTMKAFVMLLLSFMFTGAAFAQSSGNASGWRLVNYSFKDASARYERVLAGTNSRMYDLVSYKGEKGNIQISQNRYDEKTGKLLAGVTYSVIWSDPHKFLNPGEKASLDYELTTNSSLSWKPPQQSVHLNQGLYGVYFSAPDGTKYIAKDLKGKLTSEKAVEKGTAGSKRTIQVTLGNGFSAIYTYEWSDGQPISTVSENSSGWHLVNYSFKDGSARYERVLAGTNARMYDLISYKGEKGNIQISQNRYDEKTGKLLAGVTYSVMWSDPPKFLNPGEKASLDYEFTTNSSLSWKAPQQSVYLNQGLNGVYFAASDGTKYITKDLKGKLTSEKAVEKGTAGSKRTIQVILGNGYAAIYTYEWR